MHTVDARYYIYVMTNPNRTLYIGVTNDLPRRVSERKAGLVPGFAAKYQLTQLVYVEEFSSVAEAIAREMQLKGWSRAKKLALMRKANPELEELVP